MILKMRVITVFHALCMVSLTLQAAGQDLRLVERSHVDSVGSAYTNDGKIKIDLREVQAEASGPNGQEQPLSLLILFEPTTGAFSWHVSMADTKNPSWRTAEFKEAQGAFLKDGTFVDFKTLPFSTKLLVREYRGHASSMDDAEAKALSAANLSIDLRHPVDFEAQQQAHVVSLAPLGLAFVSLNPMSAAASITPRVIDVQWDGKYWTVTLQARWKEAITLDADYTLVSMRKVE